MDESEQRALVDLKRKFLEWNGTEFRCWDDLNKCKDVASYRSEYDAVKREIASNKLTKEEKATLATRLAKLGMKFSLHLGRLSGYSTRDGHVVTLNLRVDRPAFRASERDHRYDDLRKYNQMFEIPRILTGFPSLERLGLDGFYVSIPDYIFDIRSLRELSIMSINLTHIPDKFDQLTRLTRLKFQDCFNLSQLPPSIGKATNLQSIDILDLPRIRFIPESFGGLKNLEELTLSNTGLLEIPSNIIDLPRLQRLGAYGCPDLVLTDSIMLLPFKCALRIDKKVVQQSNAEIQEHIAAKVKFVLAYLMNP